MADAFWAGPSEVVLTLRTTRKKSQCELRYAAGSLAWESWKFREGDLVNFYGTSGDDRILRSGLSTGVTTDPFGVTSTLADGYHGIFAGAGNDVVELGDSGGTIYGGDGDDRLIGGAGPDLIYGGAGSDVLDSGVNFEFLEFLDGGSGADRMTGRDGRTHFIVDDIGDVVRDRGTTSEDRFDTVVTNLDYRLPYTAGIENIDFSVASAFGLVSRASTGIGNSFGNSITGNGLANLLMGEGGRDWLYGEGGADRLLGGYGDDDLDGGSGNDELRGQVGNDTLDGGLGADRLIGGPGRDQFHFAALASATDAIDIIVPSDRAVAFEGAGNALGDTIRPPHGFAWTFGGTGASQLSCVDSGTRTLVRGNIDADAAFEFQVLIEDGSVRASAYTFQDFGY